MKKIISTRSMAEIGIFAAIGVALDLLQSAFLNGIFPNGGSIGIAMIPILVMCYRRGFVCGLLTGLIMGLMQMAGGVYVFPNNTLIKAFFQLAFDYWLAYPVVAVAGLFYHKYHNSNNKLIWILVGCVLGGLLKYSCHFLSGVLFWPDDLWNVGGATLFSLLYNGAYMIPCIILCTIIMLILSKKQSHIFVSE